MLQTTGIKVTSGSGHSPAVPTTPQHSRAGHAGARFGNIAAQYSEELKLLGDLTAKLIPQIDPGELGKSLTVGDAVKNNGLTGIDKKYDDALSKSLSKLLPDGFKKYLGSGLVSTKQIPNLVENVLARMEHPDCNPVEKRGLERQLKSFLQKTNTYLAGVQKGCVQINNENRKMGNLDGGFKSSLKGLVAIVLPSLGSWSLTNGATRKLLVIENGGYQQAKYARLSNPFGAPGSSRDNSVKDTFINDLNQSASEIRYALVTTAVFATPFIIGGTGFIFALGAAGALHYINAFRKGRFAKTVGKEPDTAYNEAREKVGLAQVPSTDGAGSAGSTGAPGQGTGGVNNDVEESKLQDDQEEKEKKERPDGGSSEGEG